MSARQKRAAEEFSKAWDKYPFAFSIVQDLNLELPVPLEPPLKNDATAFVEVIDSYIEEFRLQDMDILNLPTNTTQQFRHYFLKALCRSVPMRPAKWYIPTAWGLFDAYQTNILPLGLLRGNKIVVVDETIEQWENYKASRQFEEDEAREDKVRIEMSSINPKSAKLVGILDS